MNIITLIQENSPIYSFDVKHGSIAYVVQNQKGNLDVRCTKEDTDETISIALDLFETYPLIQLLTSQKAILHVREILYIVNFEKKTIQPIWDNIVSFTLGWNNSDFLVLRKSPFELLAYQFDNFTEKRLIELNIDSNINNVKLISSEDVCYVGHPDGIDLITVADLQLLDSIPIDSKGFLSMSISPDRKFLGMIGYRTNGTFLIELNSKTSIYHPILFDKSSKGISAMAFLGSNRLLLGNRSGSIILVNPNDIADRELIREVHKGAVSTIIPGFKDTTFFTSGMDGAIQKINLD